MFRAIIYTLESNSQEALSCASNSFNICKKLNIPFNCLFNSIAPLISIFKALSQTDLENDIKNFFILSLKKFNLVDDSIINHPIGFQSYKTNGYVKFPFMKIDIFNDYGLDISDIMYFGDENVNICNYI